MANPSRETRIALHVSPGASRNEVLGFTDGVLRVKIAAPPVGGKANKKLLDFLSQVLGVGKSRLFLVKGHTSRDKVIAVAGLSQEEVRQRLLAT